MKIYILYLVAWQNNNMQIDRNWITNTLRKKRERLTIYFTIENLIEKNQRKGKNKNYYLTRMPFVFKLFHKVLIEI